MRFLLDENVHAKSTEALRDQGHDVLHVIHSQLRGKSDTDLIHFCNQENRIFVTRDLGVAKEATSVRTGLILIRVPERFVSRNIPALLAAFTGTATDADLLGHITVLSPGQIRRRALSTLSP
jgi:predicted nuclease of predicted toxin-antitoxin system